MMEEKIKVELFADVGTSEPFMARLALGLTEIVDATRFRERQKIKEGILGIVLEGLLPAFLSLREIRDFESGKKQLVRATLDKHYHDLYRQLWTVYKDRMQTVVRLLGFNIGFLFQNEEGFEKGAKAFLEQNRNIEPDFVEMLRDDRKAWQNILGGVRNDYLEHRKVESRLVARFFVLDQAEKLFQNCWQAIEEIIALLLRTGLPSGMDIRDIPEAERDGGCPKRFQFVATDSIN